ncbi:MAG: A/G-specific adenine glycosylase [Actinomycetota bacterium]
MIGPTLLAWGMPRLRDLPWRHTRDPWAVLVSEVMLQQTGVARVLPKWHAFMDEFPTAEACAAAPLGSVLRVWQGLGYPRRARNLHSAAGMIAAGGFPSTLQGLIDLPGVGAYTARAVLAFAFEADDAAVVDTNIARVLARVEGRRLGAKEVQALADEAVPVGQSWAWNQCLMELGAMLCRPVRPACAACPLAGECAWRGRAIDDDPAVGSAGVSRTQSRFEGSDRQARGRLMAALVGRPVARDEVALVMGRDEDIASRLLADLESEGLCVRDGAVVRLP